VVVAAAVVAVACGDDDGDGALAEEEAVVAHPEEMALQRPLCWRSTASLRRAERFFSFSYSNKYHSFVPANVQKNTVSFVPRWRGTIRLARKICRE
jgi:hypothetical protein